jgi:hypothetical protein
VADSTETDIELVAKNWSISTRAQSRGLYALALVDIERFSGTSGAALLGTKGLSNKSLALSDTTHGFGGEFVFDVNPKQMDLEEPASVNIVPTQDGQYVEHHGSIYKNITLSGTMGMRPTKRSGVSVLPFLGGPNPFAQPDIDPANNLPRGEKSGFETLLALRNLFRQYFDIKKSGEAHKWVMVWQNGKEGEFYVVEPMVFRTRRQSGSPLTSLYEIQLQTIRKWDLQIQDRDTDVRRERTALMRFNERLNQYNRKLANALRVAENLVDRTATVAQATLNSVISPARTLFDGLTGVSRAATNGLAIPRHSVALLAQSALDLVEEIQQTDAAINAYKQQGIITQFSEVVDAYKNIFRTATSVYAEDSLFEQSQGSIYTRRGEAYRAPVTGKPRTGGSPTDVSNLRPAPATAPAEVGNQDTIFSLAQRLLGDQARWKELTLLNDLKAPYVDPTGDGINVLRPGDTILFPADTLSLPSGVETDTTEADSIVKRLGRDIKLVAYEAAGGVVDMDMEVNSRGDLALIEGVPNMAQAVQIKFSTEQGTLPTHPRFGVALPIGSKAQVRSLVSFHMNLRASLLADSRISNINRLKFTLNGNVVNIHTELQIASADQSVAISFDARR